MSPQLNLPPLRARLEDVPLLADHFIKKFNAIQGRRITGVSEREVLAIREALDRHGGNRTRAAHDLGVSRNTLWRKMKRYEIE